jgi:hypothetical protein
VANFFTPLLGLTKQITGENPGGLWGDTLNNGFMSLVEDAISGTTIVTLAGVDIVLTTDDGVANQARAMILIATGTPGAPRSITVPSTQKMYVFSNETDAVITVKTAANAGVAVAVGDRKVLIIDQILDNVIEVTAGINNAVSTGPSPSFINNPGEWSDVTAGVKAIDMTIVSQGSFSYFIAPTFTSITVAATDFVWVPTDTLGGTPTGLPWVGPKPAVDEDRLIMVDEAGTIRDCFIRYQADGLAVEVFRCDGGLFTNPSARSFPDGVFGLRNHAVLSTV